MLLTFRAEKYMCDVLHVYMCEVTQVNGVIVTSTMFVCLDTACMLNSMWIVEWARTSNFHRVPVLQGLPISPHRCQIENLWWQRCHVKMTWLIEGIRRFNIIAGQMPLLSSGNLVWVQRVCLSQARMQNSRSFPPTYWQHRVTLKKKCWDHVKKDLIIKK